MDFRRKQRERRSRKQYINLFWDNFQRLNDPLCIGDHEWHFRNKELRAINSIYKIKAHVLQSN